MHVGNIIRGCFGSLTCAMNARSTLLLFVYTLLWTAVFGECPSNVKKVTFQCFQDYNPHQSSMPLLFSGVDVETIRALCSSHNNAMMCVSRLSSSCTTTRQRNLIKQGLDSVEGSREGLVHLCRDDTIFEDYAPHQSCFFREKKSSQRCYDRIMNIGDRKLSDVPIEELCKNMYSVIKCIETNIEKRCGEKAAKLVPALVKSVVSRSSKCSYTVVSPTPKSATKPPSSRNNNNQRYVKAPDSGTVTLHANILSLVTFLLIVHSLLKT